MGERDVLGDADVSDDELAAMVAGWLGPPPNDRAQVQIARSWAETVPYDLEAITTAGRYWVGGEARTPDGTVAFEFFVKHVQCWSRSPAFAGVPPQFRELARAGVPWYTEPLIYRSDLAQRLPPGLAVPRAIAVRDLDERSAAVWLEKVPAVTRVWAVEDLAHAAYLLGRLAASAAVRELATIGEQERDWPVRSYVEGRLALQVLPMLDDDGLWQHPLINGAFDADLRRRLLAAAERVPAYLGEIEQIPLGTAHGDACTNNLLTTADSNDLILIDFGFWGTKPFGFDLTQLLLGEIQLGRRPADQLAEMEAALMPAYLAGLRDEGCEVDPALVRRAQALCMLIYSGLSAFPIEHLAMEPTSELHRIAAERAATAVFILDLVDATASR